MKKILLFMCVLVMVVSLAACGESTPDIPDSTPSTNGQSTSNQDKNETNRIMYQINSKKPLIFMDILLRMQMTAHPVNVLVELPSQEMLIFGLFIPHLLFSEKNSLLMV